MTAQMDTAEYDSGEPSPMSTAEFTPIRTFSRKSREDLEESLAGDRSQIRAACPARFPHHHHRTRAHRHRARLGQQGSGVPQRVPAPRQSDHTPAVRQLDRCGAVRQRQSHDMHVPRMAIRLLRTLRRYYSRQGRVSGSTEERGRRAHAVPVRGCAWRLCLALVECECRAAFRIYRRMPSTS